MVLLNNNKLKQTPRGQGPYFSLYTEYGPFPCNPHKTLDKIVIAYYNVAATRGEPVLC